MSSWKRILLVSIGVIVLSLTHWFAYDRGLKQRHEEFTNMIIHTQAGVPEAQLRSSVVALKAAVKHPGDFSQNELLNLKTNAEVQLFDLEHTSIPHAKKTGDVNLERRLSSMADSAKQLLSKLNRQ